MPAVYFAKTFCCYNSLGHDSSRGELLMMITVEAVYENGLLKPGEPLPFQDHERVRVTVESARPPIWERIAELAADAPEEEVAKLPPDGAAKIDEHLYGPPRGSE